jgi:hypothetical protein
VFLHSRDGVFFLCFSLLDFLLVGHLYLLVFLHSRDGVFFLCFSLLDFLLVGHLYRLRSPLHLTVNPSSVSLPLP